MCVWRSVVAVQKGQYDQTGGDHEYISGRFEGVERSDKKWKSKVNHTDQHTDDNDPQSIGDKGKNVKKIRLLIIVLL